jgi:hypothetical protein
VNSGSRELLFEGGFTQKSCASGNRVHASGNTFYALTWFCNANSRTELGMVRELKSTQSDEAAK